MSKGSFRERMEHYVSELVNPMTYYDWINKNTTIGGVPFTCDRYPFQKEILNDMSLELHCIKPSQIGLTEVQLRKALAFTARNPHRNLIYTMPDENMRKRVYQNRVLPILTEDSAFHGLNAAGKKPIRSIEMTEINSSFMMMFPANEKAATSQPADAVFNLRVR